MPLLPHHQVICLPYLPSFPNSIKFFTNTIGFYIICKDYDSINQHSHPSTTPKGGGAGNHDHPRAGGWGCPGLCHIYIRSFVFIFFFQSLGSICPNGISKESSSVRRPRPTFLVSELSSYVWVLEVLDLKLISCLGPVLALPAPFGGSIFEGQHMFQPLETT